MEILTQKRITNNGEGAGYFRHCINYTYKEKLEPGESLVQTKGYGVCDTNPDHTYDQMYAVTDPETACVYTERIAGFFKNHYQMITAVHQEDQKNSLYHAHIVMNTVNYNNGKLYHSGIAELQKLAMHIRNVTGNYCKPIIK